MTPSAYKIYGCVYGYCSATLSCISACFTAEPLNSGAHFFPFLDSSFLCLQLNWASFGNKMNAQGQSLWRCCKGQGLGWHHACMKRFVLLGLVWSDTSRNYNIPPPDRAPAIGTSLPLPHTRIGLLLIPCSPELRFMAVLVFPVCSIKDLERHNYMILYFCPSDIFCQ